MAHIIDGKRIAAAARTQIAERARMLTEKTGTVPGLAVVIDPGVDQFDEPRPVVVTEDRWSGALSLSDFCDGCGNFSCLFKLSIQVKHVSQLLLSIVVQYINGRHTAPPVHSHVKWSIIAE